MKSISILIATLNRAALLKQTLEDMSHQEIPAGWTVEVIIIDNNSSDGTKETVEAMKPKFPWPVHYLTDSRPGKAFALNTGIAQAKGDYLIFTDDDAGLADHWLSAIVKVLDEKNPDGVGGPVKADWISPKPDWVDEKVVRQLGVFDWGKEMTQVSNLDRGGFIGPNCAYKRELFEKLGGYDEQRIANSEDIEFFQRAFWAGAKLWYVPDAVVYQKIDGNKLTKEVIRKRFLRQARAIAYGVQENPKGRTFFRAPLWFLKYYVTLHFRALQCWMQGKKSEALWYWFCRYFYGGAIYYCFQDSLMRRPRTHERPRIKPQSVLNKAG